MRQCVALVWLAGLVRAEFVALTRVDGTTTTHALYDSDQAGPFMHVRTTVTPTSTDIFLVQMRQNSVTVPKATPKTNAVIGRSVETREIIVGPSGCDNANPELAVERSACVRNQIEAASNRDLLRSLWFLPFRGRNNDECLSKGGDQYACLGPPLVFRDNADPYSFELVRDLDLLTARGVAVESCSGFNCAIPTIVHVDMVMPQLVVDTTCLAPAVDPSRTFSAPYTAFHYDAYSQMITNVWIAFQRDDGVLSQMRLLVQRTEPDADAFHLVLADAFSDTFRTWFVSERVFNDSSKGWAQRLVLGETLQMNNASAGGGPAACTMTLTLLPRARELRDPEVVSDLNYAKSRRDPRFYTDMSCNYHLGTLDENLQLKYPYCPEGSVCGGDAQYVTPEFPHLPIRVLPNPRYQVYLDNCDHVFPYDTFNGFGFTGNDGPLYERMVLQRHRCYMPLLVPQFVLDSVVVDERERQCFMLGGECSGRSCDVCARRITYAPCKAGWTDFDAFCYYAMDAIVDARASVVGVEARAACVAIDPDAEPAPAFTEYGRAWMNRFVLWKRSPGVVYRLPVPGSTACNCFEMQINDPNDPNDDTVLVKPCNCKDKAFPVCRYPIKVYEPVDRYILHSPATIRVLRDGQHGIPWRGEQAICACYDGWADKDCTNPTCPTPVLQNAANLDEALNNPTTKFFTKCYANKRGECRDGAPRSCFCSSGFAPPSTLLPSAAADFINFPCACPAHENPEATVFRINNVSYALNTLIYGTRDVPCGGVARGTCTVDAFTNLGTCACETRLDTNPDALQVIEPAMGGESCACRVAKVPPDGYVLNFPNIVQQVCNGARGVCCSTSVNDERCFDEQTTQRRTGCVCVNGYTGQSCTCIAPFDVVPDALQATTLDAKTYVQFDAEGRRVQRVFIAPKQRTFSLVDILQGCTPTRVVLRPFSLTDPFESVVECQAESESGWWTCPNADVHVRYILVDTMEQAPYCLVRAYEEWFPPCGEHTNPFAGRFFANEVKRRFGYTSESQPLEFAPYGCTDSECMCEPNYSGRGCRAGVSGVRPDVLDAGFVRMVCGESTQPPRGNYDATSGRCECEALTVRDTTGEAGLTKGLFQGDACACASVYVPERNVHMMCAGHGTCITPHFPYGTCDYDLDDFEADPLATPYVRFRPQVVGEFTFEFLLRNVSTGDQRSVVVMDVASNGTASSWFMGQFQRVYIRGLQGSVIDHCGSTFRTPLNATFVASNPVNVPQRAIANITVWKLVNHPDCVLNNTVCLQTQESYETGCDPALPLGVPLACSTQNWCLRTWVQAGHIDPSHFSYVIPSEEWNDYAQVCIASAVWYPLLVEGLDTVLNVTTLQPISLTNVQDTTVLMDLACVRMQSVERDSSLQGRRRYGGLDCNNAVHRTIDKALWLLKGDIDYEPQCIDLPIGPYTNVLGQFYGLLWNQVQDLRFDALRDPEDWTPEHYRFVASLLNNERWFNRTTNASVSLLDEHLLDLYIMSWVEGPLADTFLFNGSIVVQPSGVSTTIFEPIRPFVTFDFVRERAQLLRDYPGGSFDTPFVSMEYISTWSAAVMDATITGSGHAQYTFPWLVESRDFFQFRRPGITQTLPGYNIRTADQFVLIAPFDADVMQVYTDDGRPCMTIFNAKQNQSVEFTCSDLFDDELVDNRLPWSIDGYTVNSSLALSLANIAAYFNNTDFDDLSFTDQFLYALMWITALNYDGPKVHWVPPNYWGVVPSLNGSFNLSTNLTYVYATAGPNLQPGEWPQSFSQSNLLVYLQQRTYEQAWADLVDSIVVNHTWPTNGVLRAAYLAKSSELRSRPINISLDTDQKFLRDVFHTHLAPRQCTSDVDCKAQSRKGKQTCVFPADVLAKPWRNGDPALSEQFNVGDEGGCECFDSFAQGFWDAQLFCHFCRDGYGPRSAEEWRIVQQFQDSVFQRTGLGAGVLFDFPGPSTVTPEAYLDDLNASFVCRFPFDQSTDGLMCGGHGLVNVSTAMTQRTLYAPVGPRCETLILENGAYMLQPGFTRPSVMRYASAVNGTQLVVLNGAEIWVAGVFMGAPVDPACTTMERAQGCVYSNGQQEVTVRCEVPFPLYHADPSVRATSAGLWTYI